ncbi:9242_t:CDS:2 [Acaulospora colombiana]|uniref:9242_t:CDS:1 n=1 Tax=Acaulospora colombiana TaxID=27376 RepID=A0ACA9KNY8_9GLOM|nr:9242_t:CDS:2 [Acaulospora colombiana]
MDEADDMTYLNERVNVKLKLWHSVLTSNPKNVSAKNSESLTRPIELETGGIPTLDRISFNSFTQTLDSYVIIIGTIIAHRNLSIKGSFSILA